MSQTIKHVFILNPAAGKGKLQAGLREQIEHACTKAGADYLLYQTEKPGETTTFIRTFCTEHPDRPIRFYACGGDGTLGEAVNGAYGFANASIGVVPVGTGNDFVRNFDRKEAFLDIEAQLGGEIATVDLLQYNGKYCANMINIGFDCEVVKLTADLKKSKLVPKSLTYIVGLILTLIRKPGVKAGLRIDGKEGKRCDMLLTSAGNGAFCGGGFHSTPRASLCDGIMDAVIIRNVSRIKFLSLVGAYKNGTYVTDPKADGVIEYVKCRSIKYEFDGVQSICVDGEVEDVTELELSVAKDALRLIVPYGVAYRPAEENSAAGVC